MSSENQEVATPAAQPAQQGSVLSGDPTPILQKQMSIGEQHFQMT